jgi:3-hydroxybutyryl-CoA dehydrogenase
MNPPLKTIGVVGLGVMGFDIAFLYAMKGFRTLVYDAAKPAMDSLPERREQTIERLHRRNRITDIEIDHARTLLISCSSLADLAQAELITEAVSEKINTKLTVYRSLDDAGFRGLLTTNTSSVTRATVAQDRSIDRKRFALTHFFNPVLYTQMVEVVTGDSDEAHREALLSFLTMLGRVPVATQDISGFVSNGILMLYAVMALRLLERGARVEQVDRAAKDLQMLPPLISFDSWKPSIVEDVTKIMRELRGDEFLRSSRLLARLAEGNPKFYLGDDPNPKILELVEPGVNTLSDDAVKRALRTSMLVAAARVAELGEAPAVVDRVATQGLKMPKSPLQEIDIVGAASVLDDLAEINRWLGDPSLPAPALLLMMARQKQKFYLPAS